MAKCDLTADRLREVLHYNPETGIFTWRVACKGTAAGDVAGCFIEGGYLRITIDKRFHRSHRLAWLYVHGVWPEADIDHIDGNPANNAIANLRDVSRSVNLQNRRAAMGHNKTSGVLGVSSKRDKWRARIKVDGKQVSLGSFDTVEEAQEAYLAAKREHHPGNML